MLSARIIVLIESAAPRVAYSLSTKADAGDVNPKNTRNLSAALQAAGDTVLTKYYLQANHTDLLAAFSVLARKRAAVLDDLRQFIDASR